MISFALWPFMDMLPWNVFHAALASFISEISPPIPDEIESNAFCPMPVRMPKPSPLFSLLPNASTAEPAPFMADVNPLSAADSTAFTL